MKRRSRRGRGCEDVLASLGSGSGTRTSGGGWGDGENGWGNGDGGRFLHPSYSEGLYVSPAEYLDPDDS